MKNQPNSIIDSQHLCVMYAELMDMGVTITNYKRHPMSDERFDAIAWYSKWDAPDGCDKIVCGANTFKECVSSAYGIMKLDIYNGYPDQE